MYSTTPDESTLPHGELRESVSGNYVWLSGDVLVGAIYETRDGYWSGVSSDRFLKGKYDDAGQALETFVNAVDEGDKSRYWREPQSTAWQRARKHNGIWRRTAKGGVISIKQAKSGSWYASRCGNIVSDKEGKPKWFRSLDAAHDYIDSMNDC